MNSTFGLRRALVVLLVSCTVASTEAKEVVARGNLRPVTTPVSTPRAIGGLGCSECPDPDLAHQLWQAGRSDEAIVALDGVLECFAGLMTDTSATYVCVRERADLLELRRGARAHARPARSGPIIRVDYALARALQLQAFIAASRQEWSRALAVLDTLIRIAPFEPEAHCERGYVLSFQGRPAESLEAYRKALALANEHDAVAAVRAVALRGVGVALTELGRLDEAKEAYEEALRIEPGNDLARNELEYIGGLMAEGRRGLASDSTGGRP
jgi:tetratricopeptide (TPR) repeat protein